MATLLISQSKAIAHGQVNYVLKQTVRPTNPPARNWLSWNHFKRKEIARNEYTKTDLHLKTSKRLAIKNRSSLFYDWQPVGGSIKKATKSRFYDKS